MAGIPQVLDQQTCAGDVVDHDAMHLVEQPLGLPAEHRNDVLVGEPGGVQRLEMEVPAGVQQEKPGR
jgi:hypothetical protein